MNTYGCELDPEGKILIILLCNKSYLRDKFDGLGMLCHMFRNAIVLNMVSSILTSGHRPSVMSPLPAEETKDAQDLKFSTHELKYHNDHFNEKILPAAVSKHEEQHTEDDAGHADVDSNHHPC